MRIPKLWFLALCLGISLSVIAVQRVSAAATIPARPEQSAGESRTRGSSSGREDKNQPISEQSFFNDDFSNNKAGWRLGIDKDSTGSIEARIAKGKLQLIIQNQEPFVRYVNVPNLQIRDFLLNVDLKFTKMTGEYVVAHLDFRMNRAGDWYSLMISNHGAYALAIYRNEKWQELQPWTASSAIQMGSGKVNQLMLSVTLNAVSISVNGEELNTIVDPDFTLDEAGGMMFGIETPAESEAVLEFDNLRINSPDTTDSDTTDSDTTPDPQGDTRNFQTKRFADSQEKVSYLAPASWLQGPVAYEDNTIVVSASAPDFSAAIFLTVGFGKHMNQIDRKTFLPDTEKTFQDALGLACSGREQFDYESNGFEGIYSLSTHCNTKSAYIFTLIARPTQRKDFMLVINGYFTDSDWSTVTDSVLRSLEVSSNLGAESAVATSDGHFAWVIADQLYVRYGPGNNYRQFAIVRPGDALTVTAQFQNCAWLKVETPDGQVGWVTGDERSMMLIGPCDQIPANTR